jgi:hypothetical protein
LWPDQQYGAGRVVDDEAGGWREAVWSEPGSVAVADEQVGAGRGVHDLALDPAGAFEAFGGPGESGSGCGEQVLGGGGGQGFELAAGVAVGWMSAAE